ncbi:MAG: cytochrome c oxidase subunit II [Chloroflexi bacterium]|nr:cytochrome c oxidase subunit II [Chloroflexota bacterium]
MRVSLAQFLAAVAALVVLIGLVLAACTPSHPQSTFDASGPVAGMERNVFYWIFWAAVFVFVTVGGVLVYTFVRFRNGEGIPRQVHGNRRLEIAWTLAPAVVLAVVAVPMLLTLFRVSSPPAGEVAVNVKVVAHQWWWEVQYPDLDIVTANELHIPVGRVVDVTLTSNDVIHSFWVPKLGGKIDVIPTRTTSIWLKADKSGTYFGQCAEFCGISHGNMRFRVIAKPQAEFDAWAEAQRGPAAQVTGEAERGAQLFVAKGCLACHTIRGTLAMGKIGPDLTHVGGRTTIAAGLLDNTPEDLARWLRDPPEVKPGANMPNLKLSGEEVSALVAYLQALK